MFRITNPTNCCRNAEKNVKAAYTWLVERYRKGDRIYLFGASTLHSALAEGNYPLVGFSRGAYQVRALASVIHEVRTFICCIDGG